MNLALFDLDGTLIQGDSDHAFGEFIIGLGWADAGEFRHRNNAFYEDYVAGRLDIDAYVDFATAPWRDRPAADLESASKRFIDSIFKPMLTAPAVDLIQQHQRAGDLMAIVTATNDFITGPIARLLGIDALIATQLERDSEGRITGKIDGIAAFREGKVHRVQQWLAARHLQLADFERTYFYSDSTNDLPLLESVSDPVATNPGTALERIAVERGWPVLKLFT
ncbi:MAG TPA: HAD family hydrolase [Rubrivivax sp.]|nr:HAD family hydrolase [Rubrivivax sp.]